MRVNLSKMLPAALAAALAVAVAVVAVSFASSTSSSAPPTRVPAASPVSIRAQTAAFGALRGPAASPDDLPFGLRAQLSAPDQDVGVSLLDVHAVHAGGREFYVGAGDQGLCIFLDDGGSVCSPNIESLKRNGLSFSVVPPAPGRVSPDMNIIGPGTITTYGIAPDGVASIDALTSDGRVVSADLSQGAYVINSAKPVTKMSFHSANATWQTVPGGADG